MSLFDIHLSIIPEQINSINSIPITFHQPHARRNVRSNPDNIPSMSYLPVPFDPNHSNHSIEENNLGIIIFVGYKPLFDDYSVLPSFVLSVQNSLFFSLVVQRLMASIDFDQSY